MAYSPFTHDIENKGESVASKFLLADSNADFEFQDGDKIVFGDGADASVSWDNGNSKLQVVPENVAIEIGHASSTTTILGNLTVTGDTTYHNETIQIVENNSIQFEGSTADAHEIILTAADASGSDKTITLPDVTGHVALLATAATETISSTPAELNILDAIAQGSIVYGNSSAATALLAKGSANTVLSSDGTDISYTSVTNAMLAGSIADSKLSTISTADKVALSALDIDGASDVGEDLVGADLIIVDNGADGTNRKSTMTRVATFVLAQTASSVDIDGGAIDGTTIGANSAAAGTFSGVTVTGTTPTITIGDAGAEDTFLIFDGNAADFRLGIDDGTDSLEIGVGSAHGTTAGLIIDSNGHVTQIGQDSPSSGEFLKWDGSKWVAAAATVSGLAADDITAGDAAVTIATTTGNITIETQANDTDIIFNVDDGGSQITALTLDGSADGAAIFKSEVQAGTQFVTAVNNASADVTAGNVKGLVAVTTGGTNKTVTLPTDPTTGSTFSIKKVDSGVGRVTVTTSTDNKIDGADSIILYHQNESVTVIFAGSNNYYLV